MLWVPVPDLRSGLATRRGRASWVRTELGLALEPPGLLTRVNATPIRWGNFVVRGSSVAQRLPNNRQMGSIASGPGARQMWALTRIVPFRVGVTEIVDSRVGC